jgi:2'-5' RNA ligase
VEDPLSEHRLFFAFWPDEATRAALEAARAGLFPLSGRPVEPANLHVTVAFLGGVEASRLERLAALAGPVAPFTIAFDRLELWRKPKVLTATSSQPAPRAAAIVDGLWQRLDRLGFARDPRPFVPHVTLARDVRSVRPGLRWTTVAWTVDRVCLVESTVAEAGVRYLPLA